MIVSPEGLAQDVTVHVAETPKITQVNTLTNDNIEQPGFESLIKPKYFPKTAVVYEAQRFESRVAVLPPPPEPAPWTATAREWLEWTNKRDRYELSQVHKALDEEAVKGIF